MSSATDMFAMSEVGGNQKTLIFMAYEARAGHNEIHHVAPPMPAGPICPNPCTETPSARIWAPCMLCRALFRNAEIPKTSEARRKRWSREAGVKRQKLSSVASPARAPHPCRSQGPSTDVNPEKVPRASHPTRPFLALIRTNLLNATSMALCGSDLWRDPTARRMGAR